MSTFDILLPKMGESVAEATITRLLVQPGESVASDAPIVEIATDKVDSEVPAPEDGVLVEWLVAEGQTVQVGMPLARFAPASASTAIAAAVAARENSDAERFVAAALPAAAAAAATPAPPPPPQQQQQQQQSPPLQQSQPFLPPQPPPPPPPSLEASGHAVRGIVLR